MPIVYVCVADEDGIITKVSKNSQLDGVILDLIDNLDLNKDTKRAFSSSKTTLG